MNLNCTRRPGNGQLHLHQPFTFFLSSTTKTLKPMPNSKFSPMADNQNSVLDLNRIIYELMSEHSQGVEEVHLEPQSETVKNAEPETQPVVEEPVEE